jgi:hypothetical protein
MTKKMPDIYDDARIVAERHRKMGFKAGIEAAIKALEADAKLCDCAALEERDCACGAWADYKTITSTRAIEIVRNLANVKRPSP